MAVGTVLIRYASRHSDPVAVTAWHMLLGTAPLLLIAEIQTDGGLAWTLLDWARMGYASLFGSALAYGLFFWFANRRDLTSFSSLGFLTPVFALATGGWLLGERLDLLQWVGVLMVLVSVVFVSQRRRFGSHSLSSSRWDDALLRWTWCWSTRPSALSAVARVALSSRSRSLLQGPGAARASIASGGGRGVATAPPTAAS